MSTCYFCHKEIDQKDPWGTFLKDGVYEYFHIDCQKEHSVKVDAKKICDSIDKFLEEEAME